MGNFTLKKVQFIPDVDIETCWKFFSSPRNLKVITPDSMGFDITSELESEEMYTGQIITYTVKPLLNIPTKWMTEITAVDAPHFFIDEQRMGPYKMWHHQHLFKEKDNGVEMTDIINYIPPLGFLGNIANALFIRKQLETIFDYRFKKVKEIFG